jgi:hypothetical protein
MNIITIVDEASRWDFPAGCLCDYFCLPGELCPTAGITEHDANKLDQAEALAKPEAL